ncbi:MAG: putative iron-regulated protein [Cognaticolwellia sp.]|jgi:putative iron-regulated protein
MLFAASCNDDSNTEVLEQAKTDATTAYATFVYDSYQSAYDDATALKTAIEVLTTNPTDATLQAAKNTWLAARESYGPTEAFRFADGPIDIIGTEEGPEGLLNSWPLDEAYIDYVDGSTSAGIINDLITYPTIDKALLESLNGQGGEENVSIGYHAIEFLLWGQDLTSPSTKQAGQRPYTDFVDGGTASNQNRRNAYLEICSDLLLEHLQILLEEWKPGGAYRNEFLGYSSEIALSKMMTAIATLSKTELAGERMFVAYDNQDQEDEHSCFSDNTDRDIRLNFAGIKTIYSGLSTSIHDIIVLQNPTIAAEVEAAMTAAETAVEATATPFDFAITDATERPKVLAAVNALRDLGDKLVEGGSEIEITVTIID